MRAGCAASAALAVLAALALGGCGSNMDDLRTFVAAARAHKVAKIPPIPKMTPYVAFTYRQAGRRDPFVPEPSSNGPASVAASDNGIHPDSNRPRQPLEQYPLDALRMVGTLSFKGVLYAMVSAPDNVIHRVTAGDYMGQNFGRIVKITPDAVELTEIVPNGFGGWQHKSTKLALSSDVK